MRTRVFLLVALALVLALPARALAADFVVRVTSPSAYTINGHANPTLRLKRGSTYTFDIDAPGHPFFIKTVRITGTDNGFDTGVTNNGIQTGTLTFTVPLDTTAAPSKLFYQCSVHAPMTGKILIEPPTAPAPHRSPGASSARLPRGFVAWTKNTSPRPLRRRTVASR
jgi:hypothetical protein